jgi:hypothetical protein
MLDHPVARLRYAFANGLRRLTCPWHQSNIRMQEATTLFGCSYGEAGWHHIRQTLCEYDANPTLEPAASTLALYLKRFLPESISVLANVIGEEPLPLFVYPWGTFTKRSIDTPKDPWASRFCGPSTDDFVTEEFQRTIRLYSEMRQKGYKPTKFPHSFIQGAWLEANDGNRRFVVLQGNHRLAVLAHMGSEPVAVRVISQALGHIRESDIENWPLVANGRCSLDNARRIFNLFFSENGWHIARRIDTNSGCIR